MRHVMLDNRMPPALIIQSDWPVLREEDQTRSDTCCQYPVRVLGIYSNVVASERTACTQAEPEDGLYRT